MQLALDAAREHWGATAPNPPVGAVVLSEDGGILGIGAHTKAGQPHAEILALQNAALHHPTNTPHTLVVTLEPCNHFGKTGPCTEAILQSSIRKIVIGTRDPNPHVASGGAKALQDAVRIVEIGVLENDCKDLIGGFRKRVLLGRPRIRVKQALRSNGSMIPDPAQKTFTRESSLLFSHQLRRQSDAFLTGSGTVLADNPLFTVRKCPDHSGKVRTLLIADRRRRIPNTWIQEAATRGLRAIAIDDLSTAIFQLGSEGANEILVEAGPTLLQKLRAADLWDEWIKITHGESEDLIETERRPF